MTIYLINIILSGILALIAQYSYKERKKYSIYILCICAILVSWIFLYVFRDITVGSDTWNYIYSFDEMTINSKEIGDYLGGNDKLFYLVEYICNTITGGNWYFFTFIISLITYVPILIVIIENSRNTGNSFTIPILMYIFTLQCYFGYNGMRQAVAISLSFLAYMKFFRKNSYIKYFIMIFFAWGFHSTVIYIIPIHFLTKLKFESKILWFIILLLIISSVLFEPFWNLIMELLTYSGNEDMALRYMDTSLGGSGNLRIIVGLVPLIFGMWKYKLISKRENIDYLLIFIVMDVIMMIFSKNIWLFARIAAYINIYLIIFIPNLEYCFEKNSKKIGMIIILLFYFLYMTSMMLHGEYGLYPYSFNIL